MTQPQVSKVEDPNNLYAQLTAADRFSLLVPMLIKDGQGNEIKLPMIVLNGREEREAQTSAFNETIAVFKHIPKADDAQEVKESFKSVLDSNTACWTFFHATRTPGDLKKKFFLSKNQVEDQYTSEELGVLSNSYLTVRLNQPHVKILSETEENESAYENLIQEIITAGKQPDFFLNSYTTHSLKLLIHYLVAKQENSVKDNGSPGSL
jgi:hypothetical protein